MRPEDTVTKVHFPVRLEVVRMSETRIVMPGGNMSRNSSSSPRKSNGPVSTSCAVIFSPRYYGALRNCVPRPPITKMAGVMQVRSGGGLRWWRMLGVLSGEERVDLEGPMAVCVMHLSMCS
jgi:hypothetical protein